MSSDEKLAEVEAAVLALAKSLSSAVASAAEQASYYTSENLPPGYRSRAAFHGACRAGRIPNAHKCGRIWAVRTTDFHAPRRPPLPTAASNDTDDPVLKAQRAFARARSRRDAA
jgi:hypothetical protein